MNRNDVDPGFRKWLATYRGGGMYDFGSHLVDFVVELLGAPNEISVFERPDPDGLSDNTLSVLLYDKAIASLRVTERAIDGFQNRSLSIIGNKGSFFLLPLENFSRDPEQARRFRSKFVSLLQRETTNILRVRITWKLNRLKIATSVSSSI